MSSCFRIFQFFEPCSLPIYMTLNPNFSQFSRFPADFQAVSFCNSPYPPLIFPNLKINFATTLQRNSPSQPSNLLRNFYHAAGRKNNFSTYQATVKPFPFNTTIQQSLNFVTIFLNSKKGTSSCCIL